MAPGEPITLYQWILQRFSVEARADFVALLRPHFQAIVKPGSSVLDLCCGVGPFAFLFESLGASVTAIDNAPFMLELAREEAARRNSQVEFILADVLQQEFEPQRFDLVAFLGNTLSDFPYPASLSLMDTVERCLAPAGRFAIHYIDGVHPFVMQQYRWEEQEQEAPIRVTRRFGRYQVETASIVEWYLNESTGEQYEYTSYIYTAPVVRWSLCSAFRLERSIHLSERSLFEIYRLPDRS